MVGRGREGLMEDKVKGSLIEENIRVSKRKILRWLIYVMCSK